MSTFLLSQIVMGIAIISQFLSFQQKKRIHILCFHMLSAVLIGIHFYLLEQYVATGLIGLAFIRIFIACFRTDKYLLYLFLLLNLIVFAYFYVGFIDILPLISLTFATLGSFQKESKSLRYMFFISSIVSIIFQVIIFTPVGILYSSIAFISNTIGYYKHEKET